MKDIFKQLGITDEFGNQITESNLNPVIGYKIKNKITNNYIPTVNPIAIMGEDYVHKEFNNYIVLHKKMGVQFNPNDWFFEPIYFSELDTIGDYILLYTNNDFENFGLFN